MPTIGRSERAGPRAMVFELMVDETPLYLRVAETLAREYGVRVVGATLGKRYDYALRATTVPLYNLADFCRRVWRRLDAEPGLPAEYERLYGDPFLSGALIADRFFSNFTWYSPRYDGEYGVKFLVANLMFWEELIRAEDLRPGDAFIIPGVAYMPHITAHLVAKRHGLTFCDLFVSREGRDRFVISDAPSDNSSWLRARFEALRRRPLTEAEREEAESFIRTFRATRMKPGYMQNPTQHRKLQWKQLRWFMERTYNYYVRGWRNDPFDFITLHPVRYATRDLTAIGLAKVARWSRLYEAPRPGERYIFFPLQLQPEATTSIWAPYWENQIAVVENLAKSTPIDCKLYVKEHYSSLGRRPLGYYRRIARLPNVRLITPFADSHELIEKALVVVTITSTVGWEAILYERPVVTLGDVFYNVSGLNHLARSFEDVPHAIKRAIETHAPRREELLKFILAVRRGYLEGDIGLPHVRPEVLRSENVQRIARSLHDALARL